jgi:hypothetical protein
MDGGVVSRFGAQVRPSSEVQDWMSISTGTGEAPVNGYQRPSDWLTLPTVSAGEQRIVGIVAIRDTGLNRLAIRIAGAYTVDWGDGSAPANFATGTVASHAYTWADIPAGTLTSTGYRQVLVSITMQAGQTMTSVHFDALHPSATYSSYNRWIDIRMAGSSVSSLSVTNNLESGYCEDVERFDYIGTNAVTDLSWIFYGSRRLRQVVNLSTASATDTTSMFESCSALISVPAFNLSSATATNSMFYGCGTLEHVPAFTMNTTTQVDGAYMFGDCDGIKTFGAMNLSKVVGKGVQSGNNNAMYSYSATNSRVCVDLSYLELTGAELDTIYGNLATITDTDRTISTATCGTSYPTATYTTTASHGWVPGNRVVISGITPSQFNVSGEISSVPAANQFRMRLTTYPAGYVSGGTVTHDTRINVSGTDGSTSDTPSIATAKGWTVYS